MNRHTWQVSAHQNAIRMKKPIMASAETKALNKQEVGAEEQGENLERQIEDVQPQADLETLTTVKQEIADLKTEIRDATNTNETLRSKLDLLRAEFNNVVNDIRSHLNEPNDDTKFQRLQSHTALPQLQNLS